MLRCSVGQESQVVSTQCVIISTLVLSTTIHHCGRGQIDVERGTQE